ncbi:type II toxin-antitoxin system Phd/YefM family antitoxin [Candidatus Gottesmanbacteria bacterium]|nr:type II toxin-antitoxin system Phd/YefM family antitoxin [Candidatus Gottesmanbacteria bacterium]
MRVVSTFDFRSDLSRYLEDVAATEVPLVVARFGRPLVIVKPYATDTTPSSTSYYGFMGEGASGETFLKRVRRSAREKQAVARFRNRS